MYRLAKNVELTDLTKYGLRPACEWPEFEKWCCNDYWYNDMWLIPLNPDRTGKPMYSDEDDELLLWELHVVPVDSNYDKWRVDVDMCPSCTYHISNHDCEEMFAALHGMIKDGVIEEDTTPTTSENCS